MIFEHKTISKIPPIIAKCNKQLFYSLYQLYTLKSRNFSNLKKGNLYRFYFLIENNKYVLVHGLITRANKTNVNFASLGRRFFIYTIISNVYVHFCLSMDIPTMHF